MERLFRKLFLIVMEQLYWKVKLFFYGYGMHILEAIFLLLWNTYSRRQNYFLLLWNTYSRRQSYFYCYEIPILEDIFYCYRWPISKVIFYCFGTPFLKWYSMKRIIWNFKKFGGYKIQYRRWGFKSLKENKKELNF